MRKYGWKPDIPDKNDKPYALSLMPRMASLPPNVDLRPDCPPVYDQGNLGSCTANALGGNFHFDLRQIDKTKSFMPSRLFIYYNERAIEGSINEDSGAMIRDGIKSMAETGVSPEGLWPYDVSKFKVKPIAKAFERASENKISDYALLNNRNLTELKTCLASGHPFVFGFGVYTSFESQQVAQTGVMPMPKPKEKLLGGHAVMAVGYDDKTQRFTIRNSWGTNWADKGYFYMPYSFIVNKNYCDDFWTIRK